MNTYINPKKESWKELIKRPVINQKELGGIVSSIIQKVKTDGDLALKDFTLQFDKVALEHLQVAQSEIEEAKVLVSQELIAAIQSAYDNIYTFHESQQITEQVVVTMEGVKCWRKSVAIEKVGLYIPGGSAPLFSTILMLGIPAKIAKCKEVILCTPPDKEGKINPAILYTANLVGISKIYKVGGAQAIAAMAVGTATIPQVYKIFGPGNQYVTKAKELVQQMGVAIDMPAGPSEVLIVADNSSDPEFIAADLLSQAEHRPDSQEVLLTDNEEVLSACRLALDRQVQQLPRKETALKALENSIGIVFNSISTCLAFSNYYAPEHLIIASENAMEYADEIVNAGSVFLGNYSCESAGDYASGTNHTLPTNGFAKNYSGVSLDSFVKKITFQELTIKGLQNIGKAIEVMAEAEGLYAHKNAVTLRLNKIKDDRN